MSDHYERARADGWNARRRGEAETRNPYTPGASRLYQAWRSGWRERDAEERKEKEARRG